MSVPPDLGHYKVLRPLGRGGMGEVYAAEDTRLRRQVAIKLLPTSLADDPERQRRLEREAQSIAALNHPGIVTIHAIDEFERRRFIVMELVDGTPLDQLLLNGPLSLEKTLQIGVDVSTAIGLVHERGITHRDLKPANVMLAADGRVKVLDFGLAKATADVSGNESVTHLPPADLTGTGTIVGTVAYMSPEQAQGQPVDGRSDIFSLGVMLYEMATGQRPFAGATSVAVIASILRETPRSITELNPRLPDGLARVIRRALEKDPSRRYQSAFDLRNDLESRQLTRFTEGELGWFWWAPDGKQLAVSHGVDSSDVVLISRK